MMSPTNLATLLKRSGVQPSAHRVAVAQYVLDTQAHPSAEQVWTQVKRRFPMISRATVYNSLNLFVEKKLLRQLPLAEGKVVFDPHVEAHPHFIDLDTGAIHDVPWDSVEVRRLEALKGFEIDEY